MGFCRRLGWLALIYVACVPPVEAGPWRNARGTSPETTAAMIDRSARAGHIPAIGAFSPTGQGEGQVRSRPVPVRDSLLALTWSGERLVAQAGPATDSTQRADSDAWSFDDIKDVCEAIQFVMLSIGVGCALYWYWCRQFPARSLSRIEFDVALEVAGESRTVNLGEVVALVKNLGTAPADLSELRFQLQSVDPEQQEFVTGTLGRDNGLKPLFDAAWEPSEIRVDPGAVRRCSAAVAIPRQIQFVRISAAVRDTHHGHCYTVSRLVRVIG